ncbi:hypothetical protein HCJ93_08480 [Streptomyces sp. SBST2-5]|jgi:hypothetical protein|uniref:Uncharacterized protein n=1 Tax=Streptomyces composti TaxID=2720025 RepID=A0ABX1A526_9ACTN|nr:hypothetical protein [Streptomyces composti]NJP50107.1 hypothetical protein [Streptomyces composti]
MHPYEVKLNQIVVDEERNDIGVVTYVDGNDVTIKSLHPRFGPWKTTCDKIRMAKPTERMQAKLLAQNERSKLRLP